MKAADLYASRKEFWEPQLSYLPRPMLTIANGPWKSGAYVSRVSVPMPVAPPEPLTSSLFVAGLLGLGFHRPQSV